MRSILFALLVVGCSSPEETPIEPTDATADVVDATDTRPRDTGTVVDSATDTGPKSQGGTTGKACKSDDDCDVTGEEVNQCSLTWFAAGSLFPDPVCFGTSCEPGPDDKLTSCDEGKGWCLEYTSSTRCYPKCSFQTDSAASVTGCVGKNACHWIGWTKDDAGKYRGAGYCFGGCTASSDCPTGLQCQIETGNCVNMKYYWVAKKKVGDPCTAADRGTDTTDPNCSCWMNSKVGKGYCTQFCKMGEPTCPTGFTCDAQLPKTSSIAAFTAAAKGLAGGCLKNCDADAECEPLGGYCEEGVGTGRKVCQFGVRPGSSDAGVTDAAVDGG